ncbi:hypothetical protein TNCT_331981 [Trichonephila clavata]|uniref:Uncharacterized protein n=1 Tax=Trichonephila clavata TaxID=2740835 RepID=A0A8X6FU01_TRICU|nr:hypothetical protein TNCT_331981 [Trichonephila clavata]
MTYLLFDDECERRGGKVVNHAKKKTKHPFQKASLAVLHGNKQTRKKWTEEKVRGGYMKGKAVKRGKVCDDAKEGGKGKKNQPQVEGEMGRREIKP